MDWSPFLPRLEKSETVPLRVPVFWSKKDATDRMPGVGSMPGGLDIDFEPSPPSLPFAQTDTTPSLTSSRWSLTVAELGSKAPPPLGP